jgi:phosphorylcholine metabolism protein LicD
MKPLNKPIAIEVLKEFKEIMDECGVEFCLIYGTCLGAIRDGGFVKGDTDIDTGVRHEDLIYKIPMLRQKFFEHGFEVVTFSFPYDEPRAMNVLKYDVLIDIRNFEKNGDLRFLQRINHDRFDIANLYPAECFDTFDEIEFYGMKYNVPHDVERYLEVNYGDWRTPDPNFHDSIAGVEGYWQNQLGRSYFVRNREVPCGE